MTYEKTGKKENKAILVVVKENKGDLLSDINAFDEISGLAKTSGFSICGTIFQQSARIQPKFLLRKGKLEELHRMKTETNADIVIFDDDITPTQMKNLEQYFDCPVVDRCGLILSIFKEHARTKESKIQVELADLTYSLSRLTGQWVHLSRQRGGIGLREVGEKQLELDKRLVKNRIGRLKHRLVAIDKERAVQRKARNTFFTAALVGYTNAGKSTIMNSLTGSDLLVEDKLFATLDSTIRTLKSKANGKILLSDTVGFIDKLPHQLVASFKSTLDEVRYADLLVKVVDISGASFERQITIIEKTLEELGLRNKSEIFVFNKIDAINKEIVWSMKKRFTEAIFISAERSLGMDSLTERIESFYRENLITKTLFIPYKNGELLSDIHRFGHIDKKKYLKEGISVTFSIQKDRLGYIEKKQGNCSGTTII